MTVSPAPRARVTWLGKEENYDKAQAALLERSRINSEASHGRYVKAKNGGAAASASLHVAGGNKY